MYKLNNQALEIIKSSQKAPSKNKNVYVEFYDEHTRTYNWVNESAISSFETTAPLQKGNSKVLRVSYALERSSLFIALRV
jgi:hypothetical protein